MECYKIVRRDPDGRLYSIIKSECATEYKPGEWTWASGRAGLLVYDSKYNAEEHLFDGDELYECECDIPVELPPLRLHETEITKKNVKKLWERLPINLSITRYWPIGTLAFKKVKLTKKIY